MAIKIIEGGLHQDNRGIVSFVNAFDMTAIKRFYQIKQSNIELIRAWQGHQKESKWFYCVEGSFTINFMQPDSWTHPSGDERIGVIQLNGSKPKVLYIPSGYVTGIKANIKNSILLVYSDFTLAESQSDDFRFDINTWFFKNTE